MLAEDVYLFRNKTTLQGVNYPIHNRCTLILKVMAMLLQLMDHSCYVCCPVLINPLCLISAPVGEYTH